MSVIASSLLRLLFAHILKNVSIFSSELDYFFSLDVGCVDIYYCAFPFHCNLKMEKCKQVCIRFSTYMHASLYNCRYIWLCEIKFIYIIRGSENTHEIYGCRRGISISFKFKLNDELIT